MEDLLLEGGEKAHHIGMMVEIVEDLIFDHLPHPAQLLLGAFLCHLSRGFEGLAVLLQDVPQFGESCAVDARASGDLGFPRGGGGAHQTEGAGVFALCAFGGHLVVAVGFVDGQDIGDLKDTAFDALQFVASAREHQYQKAIDHLCDDGFGLSDAHGLDDHHIEARSLAEQDGFAGFARDASKGAAVWGGADKGAWIGGESLHPRLVAQDRSVADAAGWIDGKYRYTVLLGEHTTKRFDKGTFSDARHARDPDAMGASSLWQQRE